MTLCSFWKVRHVIGVFLTMGSIQLTSSGSTLFQQAACSSYNLLRKGSGCSVRPCCQSHPRTNPSPVLPPPRNVPPHLQNNLLSPSTIPCATRNNFTCAGQCRDRVWWQQAGVSFHTGQAGFQVVANMTQGAGIAAPVQLRVRIALWDSGLSPPPFLLD